MTVDLIAILLTISSVTSVVFSGVITFLAFNSYKRTSSRAQFALSAGFGSMATGFLMGAGLSWFLDVNPRLRMTVQGTLLAVGFTFLVYSLVAEQQPIENRVETSNR